MFKTIRNNISLLILFSLPSVILFGLFFLLKPNNKELNKEIDRLRKENKILYAKNDSIYLQIKKIESLKRDSEERIAIFEEREKEQVRKVQELNDKLKKVKKQYEKANNHSANFSSADIQRYFSDSLR